MAWRSVISFQLTIRIENRQPVDTIAVGIQSGTSRHAGISTSVSKGYQPADPCPGYEYDGW